MNKYVIKRDSWSYRTIQRYGCWFYEAQSICEYRTRLSLALLVLVLSWGALAIFLSTTFIYIICLLELSNINDITIAIKDLRLNPPNLITEIVMSLLIVGQLLWLMLFTILAAGTLAILIVFTVAALFKFFKFRKSLVYTMYTDWKNKVCTPISFE